MSFSPKNITKATPAKWVKVGLSLISVSAAVSGYGLTQGIQWVSYFGLACIIAGTFITNMYTDTTPNNEQEHE